MSSPLMTGRAADFTTCTCGLPLASHSENGQCLFDTSTFVSVWHQHITDLFEKPVEHPEPASLAVIALTPTEKEASAANYARDYGSRNSVADWFMGNRVWRRQ